MYIGNESIITNDSPTINTALTVSGWLSVSDTIKCDSIYTLATGAWADHVFDDDYKLGTIEEEIIFIKENKHLRNLRPESERNKYISSGAIQKRLEGAITEIEKLYLFIEKQQKQIDNLESRLSTLETK